ncbi:sesquipedalian-1 [Nothoprocta perdicaria]|uniref:sesquipedalian-1 n=1 Tax=Nothoprocta perdicaria TaxID=30464 RepID=UPI000E1C2B20|nr:sesquipedalian-1 [Nothoprocta perdicaria]
MKLNERSLAFYATCDSPADSAGFLYKRGERHGAYHRRWFVLKGNMLFYFEERESREPVGVIVLEGCTVELCDSRGEFAFAIRFGGAKSRTYVLAAESHAAMEAWVKALSRASFDYLRLVVRELEQQLARVQWSSNVERRVLEREPEQVPERELERAPEQDPERALERRAPRENGCAVWNMAPGTDPLPRGAAPHRASGCEAEAGPRPPPVPPRCRASGGEPAGNTTEPSAFSRLHERYGSEVARLRQQWLERQQGQQP